MRDESNPRDKAGPAAPTLLAGAVRRRTREATASEVEEARKAYNAAAEVWNEIERDISQPFLLSLWHGRFHFGVSFGGSSARIICWIHAHREDGISIHIRTRRWDPYWPALSSCRYPLAADQVARAWVYELVQEGIEL